MHPATRVCLLLVLGAALPGLGLTEIGLLLAIAIALLLWHGAAAARRALELCWRTRWLLAGIALLYVANTPGEPLWPALPGFSREGLLEGTRRAGVVLVLINAVVLLQASTELHELAGAVAWLLSPLRLLRFDSERFAWRLGLALDDASRLRQAPAVGGWFERAAQRLLDVERQARLPAAALQPALPHSAPPRWQWLLPAALALAACLYAR